MLSKSDNFYSGHHGDGSVDTLDGVDLDGIDNDDVSDTTGLFVWRGCEKSGVTLRCTFPLTGQPILTHVQTGIVGYFIDDGDEDVLHNSLFIY